MPQDTAMQKESVRWKTKIKSISKVTMTKRISFDESQLLEAEKKRIREQVEGMRRDHKCAYGISVPTAEQEAYNDALDAVLQKLS